MASAHDAGCSALLQDGRLMVIGGSDANGPTANVDVFNTSGKWSPAAAMQSPRANQACAVLQTGQVLVAGGNTTAGATNTAELYDPAANSWSSLPVMTQARSGATAALLQDGRVLLAGGGSNALEIFDPNSRAFSFVGTMSAARQDAAAAVLQDGRVLIVAGTGVDASGNPVTLASSDIFDPSTGVTSGPALAVGRSKNSATTLLDGKVAVIGGSNGTNDLGSIEIFDPVAGNFSSASASLATPRSGHLAFLLPRSNEILVVGGQSAGVDLASAELFIPWDGSVQGTGMMSVARSAASGTPLSIVDGLLMVAGGSSQSTADLYSFATVKTDASDYAPGTIVTITGTGWQPGETVALSFVESPLIDTPPPLTALADVNGNISNSQFSPDIYDVNVRFYLTAVGAKAQAQNTFTDGGPDGFNASPSNFNLSLNPGQALPTGITVTYSVTQSTGNGSKHTSFPVTADTSLSGSFGTLNTASISILNYAGSASATLSGRVPCDQAAGLVTLKIITDESANQNLNPTKTSTPVNITVGSTPDSSCVVPTTTTLLSGSGQSTTYGSSVANPLVARVSATGSTPTGTASLSIDGGAAVDTETLDGSGQVSFAGTFASALAAGNHTLHVAYTPSAGSNFTASATSPDGSVTISQATPMITWANPADIPYGTPLSATQLNATANVGGNFVYAPAAGTILNAGGQLLSTTFTPTDTTNYTGGTKQVSINVLKVNATWTTNPNSKTYGDADPNPLTTGSGSGFLASDGVTATYSRAIGETVTGSPYLITTTLSASVTGALGNYTITNAGASFTITKADAHITVTPYTSVTTTYDGNPHTASGTATGVKGESLSGLDFNHTTHTNAGTYSTDYWTFTDSTGNYNDVSNTTITDSIAPKPATASITASDKTYDGNNTATITACSIPDKIGADDVGCSASGATFASANASANPQNVTATVTLTGSTAGNYTLGTNTTATTTAKINKADAHITVTPYTNATTTYDGNPHTATGTAKGVLGETLAGLDLSGTTHTDAGDYPSDPWTFTDVTGNYKNTSGTVYDSISKAPSYTTVSVAGGVSFTYDSYSHPATVSVISVGVSLTPLPVYSPCGHAPVNVADSGCVASYTYAGDANHLSSSDSKTYSITPAALSVTANNSSMTLNGTFPALTGTLTGVLGADGITATYTTTATGTSVGSFPITPVLSDPNGKLSNYTVTKVNGTLAVTYLASGLCDGNAGHQILQPINWDNTSTFKQGSTVPAKFRVCDARGNSISAPNANGVPVVASFNLIAMNGGTLIPTVDEAVDSTTPDSAFRWDPTAQQWIFNISTKSLPTHYTYTFQINLNDGSFIQFVFGLPK